MRVSTFDETQMNKSIRKSLLVKRIITLAIVFSALFIILGPAKAILAATGSQVRVDINYIEETATVSAGSGGSTKLFMSTDNQKTWDLIDSTGVVDIVPMLKTKEVSVFFKGNKDTNPLEVKLQAENKDVKVAYTVEKQGNGEMAGVITVNGAMEYKKGTNGAWKPISTKLYTSMYEIKGATLYFRIPATVNTRASKVVSIRVPKKPTAPSVKLDGSKFQITGLKKGETQYRVGDNTAWIDFAPLDNKTKTLDLAVLFGSGANNNTPIPGGTIEFRKAGTDKKIPSAIKVIEVAPQPVCPASTIAVTGSSINITDNTPKIVYEYTVVKASTGTIDVRALKWTSIKPGKPVTVSKTTKGDRILVRVKSYTDATTKQIIPASTYREFTVS